MKASSPVVKHLVLVGGGHSHLSVLKRLGMKPVPGLAVTLISRDINTPYSGSLPDFVAGLYDYADIHIDLRPLAQFAGARIIQEEISSLDLLNKQIRLQSRPAVSFDLLSLNIGSGPDARAIPGAAEHAIGVKPINLFIQRWQQIFNEAVTRIRDQEEDYSLVIVGGGPASVELAFAAQHRVHREPGIRRRVRKSRGNRKSPPGFRISILSADDELLKLHNRRVRDFAGQELERRGVELLLGHKAVEFQSGQVICEDADPVNADAMVFATGASIPQWPGETGLAISDDGFIEVNRFLQSTSHEFVFAAGDAATVKGEPRPKSGVYAVRQGGPLAENLVRYATGKSLKTYRPQRQALALMSMGDRRAIASRRQLFSQGRWLWRLKRRIDTRFLRKYSRLPAMKTELDLAPGLMDRAAEKKLREHAMRCAGCGAKVAGNILEQVLGQLPQVDKPDILSSRGAVEDASLIELDDGRVLVQSVDQLRAFINDPWLFARIATNHCLSDIYAMGCEPHSALALVGLPFADRKYTRAQLSELMLGCSEALGENDCALIGGHSAESGELFFGLCVNGFLEPERLLRKSGLETGDILILTKALGTGTLLAADMRCKASHRWMDSALEQMAISNRSAAAALSKHRATACTDITGFGLAGHLLEMLEADGVEVEISLSDIPVLAGALETLGEQIFSSLHQDNSAVSDSIVNHQAFIHDPRYQLLFDPQTAGGLLAGVPEAAAEDCLRELRDSGHVDARAIGRVAEVRAGQAALILR